MGQKAHCSHPGASVCLCRHGVRCRNGRHANGTMRLVRRTNRGATDAPPRRRGHHAAHACAPSVPAWLHSAGDGGGGGGGRGWKKRKWREMEAHRCVRERKRNGRSLLSPPLLSSRVLLRKGVIRSTVLGLSPFVPSSPPSPPPSIDPPAWTSLPPSLVCAAALPERSDARGGTGGDARRAGHSAGARHGNRGRPRAGQGTRCRVQRTP